MPLWSALVLRTRGGLPLSLGFPSGCRSRAVNGRPGKGMWFTCKTSRNIPEAMA